MKINKNSLIGYFPLSCVEQYFLTWIERNGINDGKLYTKSFATISEVYENIVWDRWNVSAGMCRNGGISRVSGDRRRNPLRR